ncbi:hypothetical protein AVEN_113686-1 [Araneus ventricosus]|uniref:Uncharacterized protein n=1 Tax=Araneus ventricosus TaxID=182803 RepID=A0A4Y2P5Z9_ARAVE|nr:hypothetical protein AVEN_113686-1 [Araneus ventricosus]
MQNFEETTQELVEGRIVVQETVQELFGGRIDTEKMDCFPHTVVRTHRDWTRIPDTATRVLHLFMTLPTMVAFITRIPLTDNNDHKIYSYKLSDISKLVKDNLDKTITGKISGKFENRSWKKVETKLRNDIVELVTATSDFIFGQIFAVKRYFTFGNSFRVEISKRVDAFSTLSSSLRNSRVQRQCFVFVPRLHRSIWIYSAIFCVIQCKISL